jgi:lysophospholipase L1-like esterase
MKKTKLNQLKSYITIILILATHSMAMAQKQESSPFPSDVKRILFLGNSITYAGDYVTNIEAYFISHYPAIKVEFINAGLPSETVSGLSEPGHADGKFPRPDLHERLSRVLKQTKPDWVFACYGMNDGIYLPLDEERFRKFKDGISWLHDELVKASVKKIIHLTPPVFDERKGGHAGYAHVLDEYSDWLLTQRSIAQWNVTDIHGAMKLYQEDHIKKDSSFALAADGVHPGKTGHWLISKQILLYLGENDIAEAESITDALATVKNGEQILKLIDQRQKMMKDAWLTSTGHLRPGMNAGLPMRTAKAKSKKIKKDINSLRD